MARETHVNYVFNAVAGTIREYLDAKDNQRRLVSLGGDVWRTEDGSIIAISIIKRKRFKHYNGRLFDVGWLDWNPWDAASCITDYIPIHND